MYESMAISGATMKQSLWKVIRAMSLIIGLIIVVVWALESTRHDFKDLTQTVAATVRPLPIPSGSYKGVVWFSTNQLIFLYASNPSSLYSLEEHRMFRYTIGTTDWKILKLPQEDLKAEYAPFYRLSNGKLAFGYSYIDIHEHNSIVNPEIAAIYMWDDQTNHFEVLLRYDEGFFNGTFTFSPDMSESILENPVGSGYHNQLYRFDRNKQMTRLLADYDRVSDPSWSPDGRMIVFLCTESYTPKTLIGFLDWNLLRDRFFYPWDLYLMDANGKNVRI